MCSNWLRREINPLSLQATPKRTSTHDEVPQLVPNRSARSPARVNLNLRLLFSRADNTEGALERHLMEGGDLSVRVSVTHASLVKTFSFRSDATIREALFATARTLTESEACEVLDVINFNFKFEPGLFTFPTQSYAV